MGSETMSVCKSALILSKRSQNTRIRLASESEEARYEEKGAEILLKLNCIKRQFLGHYCKADLSGHTQILEKGFFCLFLNDFRPTVMGDRILLYLKNVLRLFFAKKVPLNFSDH